MSKVPIIRAISWPALLFQLSVILLLSLPLILSFGMEFPGALMIAAIAYSAIVHLLRAILTPHHRRAFRSLRAGNFSEAAPLFETSAEDQLRRPWIDRFRWLILGSTSSSSYREMGLVNAAFCHSQLGSGTRAIALYEQALQEFPGSSIATTSLRMLHAGQFQASVLPPGGA